MRYASRVDLLGGPGAAAWDIHFEAVERKDRGEEIIFLTVGDPDFDTPLPVREAAKASLDAGRTHYGPITGEDRLKAAIAAQHERLTGQRVTIEDIVIFAGAQCALFAACQCLLDPGCSVIVLEPVYVTYPATIGAAGGRMIPVPLRPERGFHPDVAEIEAAIRPDTRAILVNSPNNPTGAVMTADEMAAIADICRRHDLWLISDEVYATLVFDGEHVSPAGMPGMAERTVTISSLSKSHAMPGWRVGWLIGPEALAWHAGNLALCMLYGSPSFVQDAALVALTTDLPEIARMKEIFRARRDLVCRRLGQLPNLTCSKPAGGMFVMLDVRATGLTSDAFAHGLLDAERVVLIPADAFGAPAAGHLRLSLTVPEAVLEDACDRITRYAGGLPNG